MAEPLKPRSDRVALCLFYLALAVVLMLTLAPKGLFTVGAAALAF